MPEKKSPPRVFWFLMLVLAATASVLLWAGTPNPPVQNVSASGSELSAFPATHSRQALSPRLFEVGPISPQGFLQLTPTPEPQEMTLEDEYRANSETAVGIAFGALILVMIVIIGTLSVMSQKDR